MIRCPISAKYWIAMIAISHFLSIHFSYHLHLPTKLIYVYKSCCLQGYLHQHQRLCLLLDSWMWRTGDSDDEARSCKLNNIVKKVKNIFIKNAYSNLCTEIPVFQSPRWSLCNDSKMLDVWKILGWTCVPSLQKYSSSSELLSLPSPWETLTSFP